MALEEYSTCYDQELHLIVNALVSNRHRFQEEKQIMVDPASVNPPMKPPVFPTVSPRATSNSLPTSACSSPRINSLARSRKKRIGKPKRNAYENCMANRIPVQEQRDLRRSKSCGEGRLCSPADEIDLLFRHPTERPGDFSCKWETPRIQNNNAKESHGKTNKGFKCGVLCLQLVRYAKGKGLTPKKIADETGSRNGSVIEGVSETVISRTVSLERFECGSWASSTLINDFGEQEGEPRKSINLYFDLPLELIRVGLNDTSAPVSSAFLFSDRDGRLENNMPLLHTSSAAKLTDPRIGPVASPHSPGNSFSSASSFNITPRFHMDKDDFNALLQIHNT